GEGCGSPRGGSTRSGCMRRVENKVRADQLTLGRRRRAPSSARDDRPDGRPPCARCASWSARCAGHFAPGVSWTRALRRQPDAVGWRPRMTASADIKLVITKIKDEAELFQALAIREVVFIEEQHVPETVERDADDARAHHLLAFAEGHA